MPNVTYQPNKMFVRNNLFEKIIKSCKATNLEFLKLKEKLGLCLYEDICAEKKFKEILTIIDSNKFDHKNKIGDFKYTE